MARTPTNVSIVGKCLFQHNPDRGDPKQCGNSWKNLAGHDANQKQLQHRHKYNALLTPYKLAGTVNILKDLNEQDINTVWERITRKLRTAGVVAWWTREVSRYSNRCHYHLIITSDHTPEQLKALVRDSQPRHLKSKDYRLQFEPVERAEWWANYCCKTTMHTKHKESFYKDRVVLFAKDVDLRKHNTIGDFWQYTPKKETPQERKDRQDHKHKMQEAMFDPLVEDAALFLAEATDQTFSDVLKKYAQNLIADPSLYQHYADDAHAYRLKTWGKEEVGDKYKVKPFKFTLPKPKPKPPVRTKKSKAAKPKPEPFDPAKCFTLEPTTVVHNEVMS